MRNFIKLFLFVAMGLFVFNCTPCSAAQCIDSPVITSVRASHILVDTKEDAAAIKEAIDNGEGFVTMAKRYSKCPSSAQGGDLGYFERGQMVKEFEDAAFSLPVGKVSEPIHSQFGWHLIKVLDRK